MKVLFVTAEVTPFSKVGGLADVAGALPKSLKQLDVDIRVISPAYGSIDFQELSATQETSYTVEMGGKSYETKILETNLPESDVPVYLIDNEELYGREGVYTKSSSGEAFEDNDDRFIFIMRATMEFLKNSDWTPDIIHCNDHHTALIPAYLKEGVYEDDQFQDIKTLFTIHNMGYQGVYDPDVLPKTGFDEDKFEENDSFSFHGKVNFMKLALRYSDKINTVSPTYAKEIMSSEEFGFGLQDEVKKREEDVSGILNGVDYSEWSPETDDLIPYNFTINDISGKGNNRERLLQQNRLVAERSTPVIGMVTRLVDQKGLDLIEEALDELIQMDMRLIVLGTGERRYHQLLEGAKNESPDKIAVNFAYNNPLAHLIEAGSDMFLMPSKYEPCGLNQMYSLKYGTIPIVHATGGLADTIQDYDRKSHKGNGFSFVKYDSDAMLEAIDRAIQTFRNKAQWKFIRDNAMRADYSWGVSAEKYRRLYESTLAD